MQAWVNTSTPELVRTIAAYKNADAHSSGDYPGPSWLA